jgi:hypothetical protein
VLVGRDFRLRFIDREVAIPALEAPQADLLWGFLDPEILKCKGEKKTQMAHYDPFKADIWAAGMILWEAVTLELARTTYDFAVLSRNTDRIEAGLESASKLYSVGLLKIIRQMLILDS